jgi:hypothetical protein
MGAVGLLQKSGMTGRDWASTGAAHRAMHPVGPFGTDAD